MIKPAGWAQCPLLAGDPITEQKGGMCMAGTGGKALIIPNGATRVLICVDALRDEELGGRWYNPYQPQAVRFESVLQLLGGMEELYDDLSFPQPAFCCRSWRQEERGRDRYRKRQKEVKRYMSDEIFKEKRGEKATFVVQVQFRQNATWQGTVTWAEKNETRHFRSTLELIRLMDESLSMDQDTPAQAAP